MKITITGHAFPHQVHVVVLPLEMFWHKRSDRIWQQRTKPSPPDWKAVIKAETENTRTDRMRRLQTSSWEEISSENNQVVHNKKNNSAVSLKLGKQCLQSTYKANSISAEMSALSPSFCLTAHLRGAFNRPRKLLQPQDCVFHFWLTMEKEISSLMFTLLQSVSALL